MAQVWKCIRCGYATWHPADAGDHEREFEGRMLEVYPGEREDGSLPHYMDDIGE